VEGNRFTQRLPQTGDCHVSASSHSSKNSEATCDTGHFYNLSVMSFSDERRYVVHGGLIIPSTFNETHLDADFN